MDFKKHFLNPENPAHRQYEALRAFFVEGKPQAEVAKQFGYTLSSLRVLCCNYRKNPDRQFFVESRRGPGRKADATDGLRRKIIELRKQNLSVHDIADVLQADGRSLTAPAISAILKEEGFSKLPRRRDDERPQKPGKPNVAAVADVNLLDMSPRSFQTKFGGLFLFLPELAKIPFDSMIESVGLPGSGMIPAAHAVRSVLALKLFGNARHTHVMSDVFDEGLGLFAGLNVIPKSSFLSQYSCRVDPAAHPLIMREWFDAVRNLGYKHGSSFDLDFHTIPSSGEDPLLEKHYLSRRSRAQKGILAFVANDTENRAFCYVNADLRKNTQNNEILKFVEFWKDRTGKLPEELVFDSTFTTYDNLDTLNKMGIKFITLRRRSSGLLDEINATPTSAWRRIELENVTREYRTPRIIEAQVSLPGFDGKVRQFAIRDLGHEYPTVMLTNHLRKSPATVIQRYARRMLIENNIADAVGFFHMDALSSMVALKVNFDLTSTVLASTLYRMFAAKIGHGYETAEFSRIFRDFINASAHVEIGKRDILVRFQKRAHNPMLVNAGFNQVDVPIPWLGNKRLKFQLG
jgi:transposase